MARCSQWLRFKLDGKQHEGYCPDTATWIDDTNLRKKGGRPLCDDHYQQWVKKVNKRSGRGKRIQGKRISQ